MAYCDAISTAADEHINCAINFECKTLYYVFVILDTKGDLCAQQNLLTYNFNRDNSFLLVYSGN